MREKSTLLNEKIHTYSEINEREVHTSQWNTILQPTIRRNTAKSLREKSTLLNEILSYSQPLEEIQRNQWERSPHFSMKYYPTANH